MMSLSKNCRWCGNIFPLSEFYKSPVMKDGTINKCKKCCRKYWKDHYNRTIEKQKQRKPRLTKERRTELQRKYRSRNPEKYKANCIVNNALRDGRLKKKPCKICGNKEVEAHHDDYSKPLLVTWLCFKHHRKLKHENKNV